MKELYKELLGDVFENASEYELHSVLESLRVFYYQNRGEYKYKLLRWNIMAQDIINQKLRAKESDKKQSKHNLLLEYFFNTADIDGGNITEEYLDQTIEFIDKLYHEHEDKNEMAQKIME